jgi:hypothetical protein
MEKVLPADELADAQAWLQEAIDEAKLIARLLDLIDRANQLPQRSDDSVS